MFGSPSIIRSKKTGPPIIQENMQAMDAEGRRKAAVKYVYGYYAEVYDKAGYSLEKTIVQLIKGIERNPHFIDENPASS